MGMFGSRAQAYQAAGVQQPGIGSQILNQIGMNLLGVDVNGMKLRNAIAQRQAEVADDFQSRLGPQYAAGPAPEVALRSQTTPGMFGKAPTVDQSAPAQDYEYQAPQRTSDGLNINSPELAGLAMKAGRLGVNLGPALDILKAQQPDVHYDRGFGYNGKTGGAMGGYHPDLEKGQALGPDGSVRNLPGSVEAAAAMAGGVTGAQERAKAPYAFQKMEGPDGTPITVSTETAAALGSNGGMIARGQSPAAAAAAKQKAEAQAAAQTGLPQIVNNASQAISLIEQIKGHPGLEARTGLRSMIPAIPGTPGADFDAMADQLKGKVFLEAFGSLKGAGQITEVEGRKATDAIARLSQRQTPQGYVKALGDLEDVIKTGVARAQSAAAGGGAPTQPTRPAASLRTIPAADRLAEARRRGLIK